MLLNDDTLSHATLSRWVIHTTVRPHHNLPTFVLLDLGCIMSSGHNFHCPSDPESFTSDLNAP